MVCKWLRLMRIIQLTVRYGLDDIILSYLNQDRSARILNSLFFWRDLSQPPGVRLREALEALGPIFVKFGQLLSTRRDVIPPDIADELAKLQDQVPPFPTEHAITEIIEALGQHPDALFASFEKEPVASASIAQVHFATLKNGRAVAVKVLRPHVLKSIDQDVALMKVAARWLGWIWPDSRRLKPKEVVAEFDKYLHDELDLMREAANASQLRRHFSDTQLLSIPEMFWDYCARSVIVMERMQGIPISHIERLVAAGIDLKQLSKDGIEIFFTQVFRDGFFHADMHPGNIMVSIDPETFGRYIALDFGIVGTLNDFDKNYLAQNFLAFFRRDYKRVAQAHIESGWAPKTTRVDELESAIRACCEPIFDRPLKDISFGMVLLRLFQTSRRFNIEIQPQLVLLQKTLLNVEGLGRQLDPDLDLWKTAQPFLEKWMTEQVGYKGLWQQLKIEAPRYAHIFPQLPRLAYQVLTHMSASHQNTTLSQLLTEQKRTNRRLRSLLLTTVSFLIGWIITQAYLYVEGVF